jgi:hypothetical protein
MPIHGPANRSRAEALARSCLALPATDSRGGLEPVQPVVLHQVSDTSHLGGEAIIIIAVWGDQLLPRNLCSRIARHRTVRATMGYQPLSKQHVVIRKPTAEQRAPDPLSNRPVVLKDVRAAAPWKD